MFRQWRWFPAALLAGTIMLSGSVTAQAVTIRIKAAFATDSPYQFVDACRRPVGMHIDILDAIAKECDLVVEYLPLATNTECLDALENGQADIILGVISPNGAGNNRTTGEISSSPVCMIVPNRILSSEGGIELKGYTAVYQYGTIDSYLISSLGFSRYIISGSQGELMDTHLSGRAAAIVGCKNSILYQLRQRGLQEDYTILHNDMATVSYAIAVPDQDYSLLYLLNNGIASLRASREYEEILNRWIISDYSEDMKRLLRVGITAFGLLGIATLAYIFINNRIRGILKRQVEEKTKEVTEANHALEKRVIQLENESDLRNRMIKYSPIGMVLFDRNFRVNLANRGACRLIGKSGDLAGQSALALPVVGEILKPIGEQVFERDFSLDNNVITLGEGWQKSSYRCNIHRILELDKVGGALLMVENVTQEEREKQELFEKEKQSALNRIIAGIAHEIKNPLMSIRTYAQLIESMSDDREFQQSFSEFVPREAERINMLVESLINYAKPVRGEIKKVRVGELIEDCLYLTKMVKFKDGIRIQMEIDETLYIQVDRIQIQQVLVNILINGMESMESKLAALPTTLSEPLILKIQAYSEEMLSVIVITDSGEGMTPDQMRNCMEPFFTTKEKGIGLGLSLSKQFVEKRGNTLHSKHSGRIYKNYHYF